MSILRRGRKDFPFLSGNNEYLVDRPAQPSPGVFSVGCDQSVVAVRIGAGLAAGEFTLLFRVGTASRTLWFAILPMRGRRSPSGSRTTTKRGRTAACSTVPQGSSQPKLRASTERKWGKRPQTPAPRPTPPSPLPSEACGENKNPGKSHCPLTKDGGRSRSPTVACVSAACQSRAGRWHFCLLHAVKRN
jgi:hypothetical protein